MAVTIAHVVDALHAFAIVAGVVGAASVVGSFVGSLPSIVGVILNDRERSHARGTWLDSHYRWQIRTFRSALAWFILAGALILTLVGAIAGVPILIALTVWPIYGIARGWLRRVGRKATYV